MPEHKYDATQALEILGAYAEKKNPSASGDAKDAAAGELLEQIVALDGGAFDLRATRHPGLARVTVSFGFGGATVQYASGNFLVLTDSVKVPVPLVFNRVRRVFEGEALDSETNPVPGERRQKRRDALAVIADAIVQALVRDESAP